MTTCNLVKDQVVLRFLKIEKKRNKSILPSNSNDFDEQQHEDYLNAESLAEK